MFFYYGFKSGRLSGAFYIKQPHQSHGSPKIKAIGGCNAFSQSPEQHFIRNLTIAFILITNRKHALEMQAQYRDFVSANIHNYKINGAVCRFFLSKP